MISNKTYEFLQFKSEFNPKGDQSRAIDLLCENLLNEKKRQTLLGLPEVVKLLQWLVRFQG